MGWKTGLCVVAGLVLALAAMRPAEADCYGQCQSTCDMVEGTGGGLAGTSCMNSCTQSCKRPANSYGAVAYGPSSHAWGTAYKWGSRAKAESTAIKNCGATDCKAVVWFNRRCGAVAADNATGDYGYDSGTSKNAAAASALRYCTSEGGKACKVVASACSF